MMMIPFFGMLYEAILTENELYFLHVIIQSIATIARTILLHLTY
jgi:hypothetical protein